MEDKKIEAEIIKTMEEHIDSPNISKCVTRLKELKKIHNNRYSDTTQFKKVFLRSKEIERLLCLDNSKLAREIERVKKNRGQVS
ncbi:hypothetical protein LCGC14_0622860 [marine sediment metagenome]|uniref:Uncharacterized protein n=1 Tax=marine sediment metagenome TaxID=412755 RepID=A0A0F9R4G8_9ZZZZ